MRIRMLESEPVRSEPERLSVCRTFGCFFHNVQQSSTKEVAIFRNSFGGAFHFYRIVASKAQKINRRTKILALI
jgi:hypothetical protein